MYVLYSTDSDSKVTIISIHQKMYEAKEDLQKQAEDYIASLEPAGLVLFKIVQDSETDRTIISNKTVVEKGWIYSSNKVETVELKLHIQKPLKSVKKVQPNTSQSIMSELKEKLQKRRASIVGIET
jgi:hypothetical protein